MTKTSSAVLEGFNPIFQVFGLPYLFRDEAHKNAVLDGPIGHEFLAAPTDQFLRGFLAQALCNADFPVGSFGRTLDIRFLLLEALHFRLHDLLPVVLVEFL